jgi:selenocysteine lyase/cysteine desulfurase
VGLRHPPGFAECRQTIFSLAVCMNWHEIRHHFPITAKWAYFDHAAVAPLSLPAQQAMHAWSEDLTCNGDVHEKRWVRRVEEVRRLVAQLLSCEASSVAFVKNTSEGIGIVAEGFPWKGGDNVVTAAEEYPANIYPWMNLANRGVELRQVATRQARIEVDDIRDAMDSHTRIVTLSAVEYASGFHNDLEAVASLCRQRHAYFFVDAIQALGVLPIDVNSSMIDFLAADGHKWLLGAEGAGVFYIRPDLVELLHPVGVGWNSVVGARFFSKIDFQLKPSAGRWESGSLNVAGITALGASLELLLGIGIPVITRRVMELTDYLCQRAERLGIEVYSSRRFADKSAIVSLNMPTVNPRALVQRCRLENIVINERGGRIRVSPHAYNTSEELDRLLDILEDEMKRSATGDRA